MAAMVVEQVEIIVLGDRNRCGKEGWTKDNIDRYSLVGACVCIDFSLNGVTEPRGQDYVDSFILSE